MSFWAEKSKNCIIIDGLLYMPMTLHQTVTILERAATSGQFLTFGVGLLSIFEEMLTVGAAKQLSWYWKVTFIRRDWFHWVLFCVTRSSDWLSNKYLKFVVFIWLLVTCRVAHCCVYGNYRTISDRRHIF